MLALRYTYAPYISTQLREIFIKESIWGVIFIILLQSKQARKIALFTLKESGNINFKKQVKKEQNLLKEKQNDLLKNPEQYY